MNYKKLYINIINKAKSENRKKGHNIYYESHHILPKSLFPLWKTKKSNLVLLTAREHFFCHQLLTKIYPSKAMSYALFRLATDHNHKVTSREYERIRIMSFGKFASFYGKHQSLEVKEKIRLSKLGKNNPNYGKHWFTNGKINICAKEYPQGFYSGRVIDKETHKKCGHKKILENMFIIMALLIFLLLNAQRDLLKGLYIAQIKEELLMKKSALI